MSGLGPAELFLILVVLVFLVIPVWAIVDALVRPANQWAAAGQSKVLWVMLLIVGTVAFALGGLVLALVYFVSIRPMLTASA